MVRNKLIATLCVLLATFIVLQLPVYSKCSPRQLQKTCDSCAKQAIDNVDVSQLCPVCSVCPQGTSSSNSSSPCQLPGDLVHLLKSSYLITCTLYANEPTRTYLIDFFPQAKTPQVPNYTVYAGSTST